MGQNEFAAADEFCNAHAGPFTLVVKSLSTVIAWLAQFTSLVFVLRQRSIPLAIDSGLYYYRIPL